MFQCMQHDIIKEVKRSKVLGTLPFPFQQSFSFRFLHNFYITGIQATPEYTRTSHTAVSTIFHIFQLDHVSLHLKIKNNLGKFFKQIFVAIPRN